MALDIWSPDWRIGIDAFDADHRLLLELIARVDASLGGGKVDEPALVRLEDVAREHFSVEEQDLARTAYPHLMEHRGEHASFVERVQALRTAADAQALHTWLVDHIRVSDRAYVDHLRALGLA